MSYSISKTSFNYIIIGILNSFIGYILIFFLIYIGLQAELSNFFGYVSGMLISYYLNKKYNFKNKISNKIIFPKFVATVGVAYSINLLSFIVLYRIFNVDVYISTIIGGIFYVLVGYLMSLKWVFRKRETLS